MAGESYLELFERSVNEIITNIKRRKSNKSLRYNYGGRSFDLVDRTQRMELIRLVTDEYVQAHAEITQIPLDKWYGGGKKGERPLTTALNRTLIDRLADAALDEELTDPNPHKVSHFEYPILSAVQLNRRRFGARGNEDTNMQGEVTLSNGDDIDDSADRKHSGIGAQLAIDGKTYRYPIRRTRSIRELVLIDEGASIRNKERAEQYKRDTSPGRVVSYNLKETGGEFLPSFVICKRRPYNVSN